MRYRSYLSDEEFPHNQISPSNVSTNQSQILRQCGGGVSQTHQQFMNRPGSNGSNQQNNNSLQQPGIPKVHQLDGYNNVGGAQNVSVTSPNCSVSSSSLPLTTMNDNQAQQQSSNIFGKMAIFRRSRD